MTKRERAQVVELLRCAADVGSLSEAGVDLCSHRMCWEAKRAVQKTPPFVRTGFESPAYTNDEYKELLLEAAARVEEGSWP